MSQPILIEDELWLYRREDGRWMLAHPWITSRGKGKPGAVETKARLRVLNPGAEIELRVYVKDCQGCEAVKIAVTNGTMQALTIEHSHGPIL